MELSGRKLSEMQGKVVKVNIPSSRWDGHVGVIDSYWLDEDLQFEIFFEVKVHMLLGDLILNGGGDTIVASVDVVADEMEELHADFGNLGGKASTNNLPVVYSGNV